MKRACPTWHGGVAHQPTAYNPVKHIAYGVGTEGCFSQEGHTVAYLPNGGEDKPKSQPRKYTSDLYYGSMTAYDTVNHKVIAKQVTDIENRSGALVTAGGVVFTALQDGWVVAYDDEKLEELWRFNVGTPAQGRAGDLLDRAEAVHRRADQRTPPASGEVRQPAELELHVRVLAQLTAGLASRSAVSEACSSHQAAVGCVPGCGSPIRSSPRIK